MSFHDDQIETAKYLDTLRMHRRALHRIPEVGDQEYKTQAYLLEQLERLSPDDLRVFAQTGVRAVFRGNGQGRVLAFRSDIDALPVFAKRPGTQEISKKLQECINAQTIQASSKHKILQAELFTLIKKHIGIQSATDIPKSITEPLTSLLKTLPLCIARTANRLIIEKIGKTTEAKIELSLDCSNTSL